MVIDEFGIEVTINTNGFFVSHTFGYNDDFQLLMVKW